jgi:hypothetical protein
MCLWSSVEIPYRFKSRILLIANTGLDACGMTKCVQDYAC